MKRIIAGLAILFALTMTQAHATATLQLHTNDTDVDKYVHPLLKTIEWRLKDGSYAEILSCRFGILTTQRPEGLSSIAITPNTSLALAAKAECEAVGLQYLP